MNELQKIEMEMLKHFVDECDRLNLRYYLVCGSALGAEKYRGFIPWDDDIDVALPRKDYELFCKKCKLPEYYCLQNHYTEKYYPLLGTKCIDKRTTYIEKIYKNVSMCHGVFIDIFPLDGFPKNVKEQRKLLKKRLFYNRRIIVRNSDAVISHFQPSRTSLIILLHKSFNLFSNTSKYIRNLNNELAQYETDNYEIWANHANSLSNKEFAPKEQYGNGAWAVFEGLKVRVPEKNDEYLTQKYGNWRADLPIEQQAGHHFAEVIDLYRPYSDYIVKLKNGKIRIKTEAELIRDGIIPPTNYINIDT